MGTTAIGADVQEWWKSRLLGDDEWNSGGSEGVEGPIDKLDPFAGNENSRRKQDSEFRN